MADPITREQVERAIERAQAGDYGSVDTIRATYGAYSRWMPGVPDYVIHGWGSPVVGLQPFIAALTRWRDELAAAKPVRRVARYSAVDDRYQLTPEHDTEGFSWYRASREQAIAWGYEIEGGPASAPAEDSPAPRLKVGDLDPVLRETARRTIALLPDLSARPLSGFGFNQLPGVDEWRSGKLTSAEWADQLDALLGAPASPPAPEVVDVPQPITKRCSLDGADIYATWVMDGGVLDLLFVRDDGEHREPVPLALLRAMLEAIDAQQGGASRLRAAEARTAWQPIETAPVDGDYVLICAPGWLAPVMAVRDGECWWMGNDAVSGATHWQPLPAAPEAT